jgi:hypothetical protein
MSAFEKLSRLGWLAAGVLLGMAATVLWPQAPLQAVATDRQDNFAICTGPVDDEFEAVFFLDFLTGELKASVISPVSYKFNASFTANVIADLQVDVSKNPKFVMVTGVANLRKGAGGNLQPGASILYVAELTTGNVAAYAVPWARGAQNSNRAQSNSLMLIDVKPFRTAVVRE